MNVLPGQGKVDVLGKMVLRILPSKFRTPWSKTPKIMSNTSSSKPKPPSVASAKPGKENQVKNGSYVDHTYHDFSLYLREGGEIIKHKKCDANFPAKLHGILSEPIYLHVIAWMVRKEIDGVFLA